MSEMMSYKDWRAQFHSGEEAAKAAYEDLVGAEEVVKVLRNEREDGAVVIACNGNGDCIAVTRQDRDGRILAVIWERPFLSVPVVVERIERTGSHSIRVNMRNAEEVRALQYVIEMADRRLCSAYGARLMDELARALKEYL